MSITRRRIVCGMAASSVGAFIGPLARATEPAYPSRPIQWYLGNAAGSPLDVRVRDITNLMGKSLGQQIVVMNRPGAGGMLAARQVTSAAPDGYNVLSLTLNHLIADTLTPGEKPILDTIDPVGNFSAGVLVLFVNPAKVPVNSVQEFMDLVKRNPNAITYATGGPGSIEQLYGKLLFGTLGLDLVEVPYPAAPQAIHDVISGNVHASLSYVVTIGQHLALKRLKALAVVNDERLDPLPDIPTFKEQGIDVPVLTNWHGMGVPKGTPKAITTKLYDASKEALANPGLRQRWVSEGAVFPKQTTDEFRVYARSQAALLDAIARKYKLKS